MLGSLPDTTLEPWQARERAKLTSILTQVKAQGSHGGLSKGSLGKVFRLHREETPLLSFGAKMTSLLVAEPPPL